MVNNYKSENAYRVWFHTVSGLRKLAKENDFVKVADTTHLRHSKMKEIQINGEKDICIVNVDGKYYAIGNVCTHEGGPLADGTLSGHEVECPWHDSKFDVRTGEVKKSPASEPEPTDEVKIDGNSILIRKVQLSNRQQKKKKNKLSPPSRPSSEYELEYTRETKV